MKPNRSLCCLLFLLSFAAALGCQQRTASKLSGRWVGRPDTAETRAARDAERYGDEPTGAVEASLDSGSSTQSMAASNVTDWQQYADVTVVMDFVSSGQLEMSLGDGAQPRSGNWKIISTSPTGCLIEVIVKSDTKDQVADRRRFELLLDEREGTCVGFQLTELGADPLLGALYFQRPD